MSEAWAVGLLSAAATLLTAWIAASWGSRHAKRQWERSEREALEDQANALVAAVLEVQGTRNVHDYLWAGWKKQANMLALMAVHFAAGFAASGLTDQRAAGAGIGEALSYGTRETRASRIAAARLSDSVSKVITTATPLIGHADTQVAEAAEQVVAAAIVAKRDDDRLADAARAFRDAVREANAEPASRLWWAPWRRREELPGGQAGQGGE